MAQLGKSEGSESYDVGEAEILYYDAANAYQAAMDHPEGLNRIMNDQAQLRLFDLRALILEKGLENVIQPVESAQQQNPQELMALMQALKQHQENNPG